MPRNYQKKPVSRNYKSYSEEMLMKAVEECKTTSLSEVAKIYKIPIRTLRNKVNSRHRKMPGGQMAISSDLEDILIHHITVCADYGMPLERTDIKLLVKSVLDQHNMSVRKFANNLPGDDWVRGFLRRHQSLVRLRTCQNIKRSRAQVGRQELQQYFDRLKLSLEGVSAENILNFDETNLADDPGQKKFVFRKGVKYPERVINFSKGNISIMFAGSAAGEMLPPYIVYKSEHLWHSWCECGPKGSRFGRSKSGWMDTVNFEEWFFSLVIPWARRKEGRKVIIGDNLSSHISAAVIDKCTELNISFILLPPNSTDKCQPLDVAFFAPLKKEWRKILEVYKQKNPTSVSLDKKIFPPLLKKLMDNMGMRIPSNLVSGFRACGIYPVDANMVLRKLPESNNTEQSVSVPVVSETVLNYLHSFKYSPDSNNGGNPAKGQKRKKLSIPPGKSVSAEDLNPKQQQLIATQSLPKHSLAADLPSCSRSPASVSDDGNESDEFSFSDTDPEWVPPKKKSKNIFEIDW